MKARTMKAAPNACAEETNGEPHVRAMPTVPAEGGPMDLRHDEEPIAGRPRRRHASRFMRVRAAAFLLGAIVAGLASSCGVAPAVQSAPASPSSAPTPRPPDPADSAHAATPTLGPSLGCSEHDVPVAGVDEVLVFFMCEPPPDEPRPVVRAAVWTTAADALHGALAALFSGPTEAERREGLRGPLPLGAADVIADVEVQPDGLAILDFRATLITAGVALNSSHNRFVLFRTVEKTTFQFEAVSAVEYRLEGSCLDFARYFETTCDHAVSERVSPQINGCPVIAPSELPSGAPTTAGRYNVQAAPGQQVSWGSGSDTVTQAVEPWQAPFDPPDVRIVIRGQPGFATLVTDWPQSVDPGEPVVQLGWVEDGCRYSVWIGPGVSLEEAIDFAARY